MTGGFRNLSWKAQSAFAILVAFLFISLTAEVWIPNSVAGGPSQTTPLTILKHGPYESNPHLKAYPSPPSKENWLGTDDRGRDLLARLIFGFRISFGYALCVWLISTVLGVTAGVSMGYLGGAFDFWGQRVVEVLESLPFLLILMSWVALYGGGFWLLALISAALGWMSISSYIRAEALRRKEQPYIEAARMQGLS
ncbi:MAG: ABC transporter permease subunit, partial [Bdellovibrionales bacterium]|nr:ABC transporter permease subunit [Bdellovibrionales bacterium]